MPKIDAFIFADYKTGNANGEFKRGNGRTSHSGSSVIVNGATSTKYNKSKTESFYSKMKAKTPYNYSSKIKLIQKYKNFDN